MEKLVSLDTGLMFWTWTTFFVVLLILGTKAWKPMVAALIAREDAIADALAAAEKAREETEALTSRYDEQLLAGRQEAQQVLADARVAGEKLRADIEATAQQKADAIVEKAREQINAEKVKAMDEVRNSVVDLSLIIAGKVLERNVSSDDNKKLAEESLNQVGEA